MNVQCHNSAMFKKNHVQNSKALQSTLGKPKTDFSWLYTEIQWKWWKAFSLHCGLKQQLSLSETMYAMSPNTSNFVPFEGLDWML